MNAGEIILFIIAVIVMLVGLAGVVLPLLPGIPVILLAVIGYLLIVGFDQLSAGVLVAMVLLTVLSFIVDWLATVYGVKRFGGTKLGMFGSLAGTIFGMLVANIPGLIIGAILGAYAGEILAGKKSTDAWRAGFGSFIGLVSGHVIKLVMGTVMIGLFVWQVLFR